MHKARANPAAHALDAPTSRSSERLEQWRLVQGKLAKFHPISVTGRREGRSAKTLYHDTLCSTSLSSLLLLAVLRGHSAGQASSSKQTVYRYGVTP